MTKDKEMTNKNNYNLSTYI